MQETEPQSDVPVPAIVRWYFAVFEGIGGALMGILVIIMAWQVLMRYGFNASLIWAEELCRYLLIWITFFMIGISYHRGQLIAVDVVRVVLPPKVFAVIQAVMVVPITVFLLYMVVNGYAFAARMHAQVIPAFNFIWQSMFGEKHLLNISIFWLYVSVSLGSALLMVHMIVSAAVGIWTQFIRKTPADASSTGT